MGMLAAALALTGALTSPALAQAPPVTPDDFVAAASGSDQYEIMAARLALVESKDPAIRAFASDMIRDHSAARDALTAAAIRSGLKPPSSSVGGDQVMLLAALQAERGAEFDKAYSRQQRLAHQSALVTIRDYARDGSDPNLRAAAQSALPQIEHHARVAQALPK